MKKLALFLVIFIQSCDGEKVHELDNFKTKHENVKTSLKAAYGFKTVFEKITNDELTLILKGSSSLPKMQKVSNKLNLVETTISKLQYKDEIMVYFVSFDRKFYLGIKGKLVSTGFYPNEEIILGVDESINKNIILLGEETMVVDRNTGSASLMDGKMTIDFIKDCQGRHGGTGFCQRENNEKWIDCYNAEQAEFCTDGWSCWGAYNSPLVQMTIAASCSCRADICPIP